MNLIQTSELLESSIKGLNIDPVAFRKEKAGQWTVNIKGAPIYIDVFNFATKPDNYYLQIMSPLFKIPYSKKESCFVMY